MSSAPSSNSGSGDGLLKKLTGWGSDLISPREHLHEPSALGAVKSAITHTRDAIMATLGATAQLPFAAAEIAVALPNNIIGVTTSGIDRYIVQPIDTLRSKVWELFWNPKKFFGGGGAQAAHGHA